MDRDVKSLARPSSGTIIILPFLRLCNAWTRERDFEHVCRVLERLLTLTALVDIAVVAVVGLFEHLLVI